jgi:2-amino-4-hydroxy-6-hydroxymethyldihydropteridine diphosphokinase
VTRYAIGVGSNLGDRHRHLYEACVEIERRLGNATPSGVYETEPVGGPDQDPYLNAVVVVETDLQPLELLDILQEIEHSHGRERSVQWGPRTLDLDIVTSDGPGVSTARLSVPHPRTPEREFVLRPLAEVWPDAPVGDDLDARSELAAVGDQGVDLLVRRWMPPLPRWPARLLLAVQFALVLAVAVAVFVGGTLPDGGLSPGRGAGLVLALAGLGLALAASRRLGVALAASPLPRHEAALVTGGPYRYARHPIYGGLILFLTGTSLALDSSLGLLLSLVTIPFFLLKAAYEERHLRLRYAGYRAYQRRVRRRLIPFLL